MLGRSGVAKDGSIAPEGRYLDRLAQQAGATRDLADRQLLPKPQLPDDGQKSHVGRSVAPIGKALRLARSIVAP